MRSPARMGSSTCRPPARWARSTSVGSPLGDDRADRHVGDEHRRHQLLHARHRVLGHGPHLRGGANLDGTGGERRRAGHSSTTTAPRARTSASRSRTPRSARLAFTCTQTQMVGGKSVTWKVTVSAGGITPASVPAATTRPCRPIRRRGSSRRPRSRHQDHVPYQVTVTAGTGRSHGDGGPRHAGRRGASTAHHRRLDDDDGCELERNAIAPRDSGRGTGITLVEVLVATAILGIVMLVFTSTLGQHAAGGRRRGCANALERPGTAALCRPRPPGPVGQPALRPGRRDRHGGAVRRDGGRVTCSGSTPRPSSSDTDEPTVRTLVGRRPERLLYRYWPVQDPDDATDWRVVAEHIVNRETGVPGVRAGLDGSHRHGVDPGERRHRARPVGDADVQVSLTGRNTSFGYPNNVCANLPSDMT